jgi:hypothetical protein
MSSATFTRWYSERLDGPMSKLSEIDEVCAGGYSGRGEFLLLDVACDVCFVPQGRVTRSLSRLVTHYEARSLARLWNDGTGSND